MASLITKNTLIDCFENQNYIKVVLFNSIYHLYYNGDVELIKGNGVNDLYRYTATKMAIDIIGQEYRRRRLKNI